MTELPDRLLRDALHDSASATPSPMCVDADALAAWADGAMTGAERAAFEIHAAGCARCQALVAAMARTDPPPIARMWWRRTPYAWLLPLATATAAVVIVVKLAVTERPSHAPAVARAESPAPIRESPAAPAPAPPAVSDRAAEARRERPRPSASPAPASAAAAPRVDTRANDTPRPPAVVETQAKAAAGAPPAASTPDQTRATAEPRDAVAPAAQPAAAPPPAPAAPAPPPPTSASAFREEAARRLESAAGGAALPAMKGIAQAPVVIASPDRESQWRITGAAVEHTTDGGVTWHAQPLGIVTPLQAGAAPAARICWLAGTGGVVLRTTDGTTWIRIAFPEPASLIAIQASDALRATVTSAAGIRFSTSDGGATWIRQ